MLNMNYEVYMESKIFLEFVVGQLSTSLAVVGIVIFDGTSPHKSQYLFIRFMVVNLT